MLHGRTTVLAGPLTGAAEVPPNGSAGTGRGIVEVSPFADQITASANFSGLGTAANAAHIHGPADPGAEAGVLFGFAQVIAGTAAQIPHQPFAITAAQRNDLYNGKHYVNVHTPGFSGGEVRAQLTGAPRLSVRRRGAGSSTSAVVSVPSGIACGGDCDESYATPVSVTLTAGAAAAGSFFAGWMGGGCTGTGSCVVTTDLSRTVTAVYALSSSPITFTDDPLAAGTDVKAVHVTDLRSAVSSLRATRGLEAFSYTDPVLTAGMPIKAVHIHELRSALTAVYIARGYLLPTFTDAITSGTTAIKMVHIMDLRAAVRLVE